MGGCSDARIGKRTLVGKRAHRANQAPFGVSRRCSRRLCIESTRNSQWITFLRFDDRLITKNMPRSAPSVVDQCQRPYRESNEFGIGSAPQTSGGDTRRTESGLPLARRWKASLPTATVAGQLSRVRPEMIDSGMIKVTTKMRSPDCCQLPTNLHDELRPADSRSA